MSKTTKSIKQLTFDSLFTTATNQDTETKLARLKQICIIKTESTTDIDELTLKSSFKLEPSHRAFSKIIADLFFEDTHINTVTLQVPQGSLGTNEFEYSWVMDTTGVTGGTYRLRVEMYEFWSSGEKLFQTAHEISINYVPQTRQARLIKIPFVKSVTGADIVVVSNQEKQLYLDIEKTVKKEQLSRRNE